MQADIEHRQSLPRAGLAESLVLALAGRIKKGELSITLPHGGERVFTGAHLTLNMLLSFAQFEREVTGERIRDKIAASKRKGMWMGGVVPLGFDVEDKKLVVNPAEAEMVRTLFRHYLDLGNVGRVQQAAHRLDLRTKARRPNNGKRQGGEPFTRGHIYKLLSNPIYLGEVVHKGVRASSPDCSLTATTAP
jgi:hypothetical protein